MSSVIDDINKKRKGLAEARVNGGAAPQQTVSTAPVAKPMGDQAEARVSQGANVTDSGLNPTAEQVAYAKMLMPAVVTTAAAAPTAPTVKPVTTYTDLARRLNPELDAAEKAKREKQLRAKKQVAAIGDAISALANMHYTGKSGVNAYDPSATLSAKAKANYDKYLTDVKTYEDAHRAAMLRAGELDAAATEARRQEAVATEVARAKAAVEAEERAQKQSNWEADYNLKAATAAAELAHKEKVAALDNATKRYIADMNAELKKTYYENLGKYKAREAAERTLGKALPFDRTGGAPIVVYENVWRTNSQQVYDQMLKDGVKPNGHVEFKMSPEDFVMTNWQKSPSAVAMIEGLSRITPDTLPVVLGDGAVENWTPDDEIIDYVPNK